MRNIVLLLSMAFIPSIVFSQNSYKFKTDVFPINLIDKKIIKKRGIQKKVDSLLRCNWKKN